MSYLGTVRPEHIISFSLGITEEQVAATVQALSALQGDSNLVDEMTTLLNEEDSGVADYDARLKEDYLQQTGSLTVKARF